MKNCDVRSCCVLAGLAVLGCGCACRLLTGESNSAIVVRTRIVCTSSPDFGCLLAGSGRTVRIVKIRNESEQRVRISHWRTSCECLQVVPRAMVLNGGEASFIRMEIDLVDAADGFIGELMIDVEAFSGTEVVGELSVPASVISPNSVEHFTQEAENVLR